MAERNLAVRILIAARDEASGVLGNLKGVAAGVAAAIGTYFGAKLFKGSVEAAEALDVQMRKLEGVIHATGGAAGLTADELDTMARRLDEATTGSAAGFRDASAQLLTFKSVGKEVFEETLMLAQDLADSGFGSVTGNAVQLGKALEDPVRGMSALARSGVSFSAAQEEVIKKLVETGRHAEAQRIILDAVAGQVGGTASAIGGGLTGALDLVGKRFTDLREQLGSAVLPVLTEFYNRVADLYGRLTESGVVKQFGETIATVFRQASDAAFRFFDSFDLDQLITKLQSFAARVGEVFGRIGENARTAGNVVQTAYGVMVAGVNAVMAAIYKIAEAFSWVVSNVLSGVALLNEGLAKITFGAVSEGFRQMAEDVRMHAGAMWAVSEEFAQRATESFERAAEGADIAQRGYAALSDQATDTAGSLNATAAEAEAVAQQATLTADALDALGEGYEYVDGEARKTATAIDATAQAGRDSVPALDSAASSAEAVAAAYERLGVTSTAALQQAAANARRDFETIRNSGTATAADIERAFGAYATKAVAANNGVVSAALQAQAASQGLSVRADESGSVIVASMRAAAAATDDVALSAAQGSGEFRNLAAAANEAAAAIGGIKKPDFEGVGGLWDKDGNLIKGTGGGGTYKRMDNGQAEMLARAREIGGLELEKRIKDSWAAQLHKRRFSGEWGWYLDMLRDTRDELDRMALAKERAERKAAQGEPPAPTNRKWTGQPARDSDDTPARPRSSGRSGGISPDTPRAARSSGISQSAPARTINMNISLNNKQYAMQNMPEQSAQTLETMLRDLERAAGVAQ